MTPDQIVEAALFASQTPLSAKELAGADDSLDVKTVRAALAELRKQYEEHGRAFQVYQLGDGFQILTRPEFAPYLERFESVPRPPTLSRPALETLAIIAYRQPVGRIEVEEIRGVASASVLRTLMEWDLVAVVGRGEGLGRPLLYGTTKRFLDHFALQSLDDLPVSDELSVSLVQPGGELGRTDVPGQDVPDQVDRAAAADGEDSPPAGPGA